ncbi:MAG: putative DNA modification/repair radical SAM protein, partial [Candidatus Omnitrophota bacterium]
VRLYQADILIRKYGFKSSEIPYDENGNLVLEKDPKLLWAEKNPSFFPLEINKADFEELLRVPGIGFKSAKKIIEIRKENKINSPSQIKRLKIRLNIACRFLLFNGKKINPDQILPEPED